MLKKTEEGVDNTQMNVEQGYGFRVGKAISFVYYSFETNE